MGAATVSRCCQRHVGVACSRGVCNGNRSKASLATAGVVSAAPGVVCALMHCNCCFCVKCVFAARGSPQLFCDRFHGTKELRDKLGTVWRHDPLTCVRCSRSKTKKGVWAALVSDASNRGVCAVFSLSQMTCALSCPLGGVEVDAVVAYVRVWELHFWRSHVTTFCTAAVACQLPAVCPVIFPL